MVYDHAIYDINYIFGYRTNILWGYDYLIGDFSAILFMVLCGISCNMSRRPIMNGLKVYGIACCLTVITGIVDNLFNLGVIINFGILHMLGIAMILCEMLKKLSPILLLAISVLLLSIKQFLSISDTYWLFPIGFHTFDFYSSDYYPLLPYVGVVLIGFCLGKILYKEKRSLFPFSISGKDPISFLGRHSLVLYVTHQPIVLIIIYGIIELLRIAKVIQ
jgi:uncharacterized membrane protein